MNLSPLQRAWLAATLVFFGVVLLDVFNLFDVPGRVLIVVPILLCIVGMLVGPSFKELTRANRRG